MLAILWALPNTGPSELWSWLIRARGRTKIVDLQRHGQARVVGNSVLMFDDVSIEIPSGTAFPAYVEVVRIFSGTREDLFPRDVDVEETSTGILIKVRSHTPREFEFSDEDLELLRRLGPRIVMGDKLMPLWNRYDIVDSLIALAIGLCVLWSGRRRSGRRMAVADGADQGVEERDE